MNDLKFTLRKLLRDCGFTVTAILILAVGIGANVAVFRLIYALHFAPLPVASPGQLVAVLVPETGDVFSESAFDAIRQQTNEFSGFAAYAPSEQVVRWKDQPSRRVIEYVSPNYFPLLGVDARLGRTLTAADRNLPNIVISDRWWEQQFQRDPAVIGRVLQVQGRAFTIIGVAPRRFSGLSSVQPAAGWIPFKLERDLGGSARRMYGQRWLNVFGRLRPGVGLESSVLSLRGVEDQTLESWMIKAHRHIELVSCGRGLMPAAQRREGTLISLFAASVMALVLLAALANLAGLQLTRGISRRKEIAVRIAIGATRFRVMRQLLLESLVLAVVGGGLGALFSSWGIRGFLLLVPQLAAVNADVSPGGAVFGFAVALSASAAFLFGLLPAFRAGRTDLNAALKHQAPGVAARGRWFNAQNLLVVSQVAISVVLLIAAGLIWRSQENRRSLETGFDSRNVIVANTWDREPSIGSTEFTTRLAELRNTLGFLPGVQSVSLVSRAPMGTSVEVSDIPIGAGSSGDSLHVTVNSLSPGFFDALKIPLRAGRDFTDQDRQGAASVAIISERLAKSIYPNGGVLGKIIRFEGRAHEIIGIVKDVRYMRFDSPDLAGTVYLSALQHPYEGSPDVLIRADREDHNLSKTVATVIQQADPGRQTPLLRSYLQYMDELLVRERATTHLLAAAAFVGLGLVILGLYGVTSYQMALRTREIGLRMALGALRRNVLMFVFHRGLVLTGVGAVIGLVVGLGISQLLRNQLFGVGPTDPLTLIVVGTTIVLTTLLACWLPARRAANVDPMTALRTD